jgi:hypothetical protein
MVSLSPSRRPLAALLLLALFAGGVVAHGPPFVLLPSTLKVRPHQSPWQLFAAAPNASGSGLAVLTAANEYESFQLAGSGSMWITDVAVDMEYDFAVRGAVVAAVALRGGSACGTRRRRQ